MRDHDIPTGSPVEDCWLPLEQVASACSVEPEWLIRHIEEGLFSGMASVAGTWRFSTAGLARARRMRELERNFDAVPELAALVADMLEEMDRMRSLLHRAGFD